MLQALRSNGRIRDPEKTYSGSRIRNTGSWCMSSIEGQLRIPGQCYSFESDIIIIRNADPLGAGCLVATVWLVWPVFRIRMDRHSIWLPDPHS
jgi:hypothetical protein